jgi:hypothetical protein
VRLLIHAVQQGEVDAAAALLTADESALGVQRCSSNPVQKGEYDACRKTARVIFMGKRGGELYMRG